MKTKMSLLKSVQIPFILVFMFYSSSVHMYSPVLFQKLCLNDSIPEIFPSYGESSSGFIVLVPKKEGETFEPGLNCSIPFTVKNNFELMISFSNISLRNSSMDNITVLYNDGKSEVVLAGQQVCSNENCEGLKFESGKSGNIVFNFISANVTVPKNITGFKATYTVFDHANPKTGACRGSNRFMCENDHCIWDKLVCDGHNNCGDRSDEIGCNIPVSDTVWGIVVIVIAVFSLLIFVPLFCFLAIYGTRSIVKSITVSAQSTPLYPTVDGGETSGLLASSGFVSDYCASTSYEERRHSFSYGALPSDNPDPTPGVTRLKSFSDSKMESNEPL